LYRGMDFPLLDVGCADDAGVALGDGSGPDHTHRDRRAPTCGRFFGPPASRRLTRCFATRPRTRRIHSRTLRRPPTVTSWLAWLRAAGVCEGRRKPPRHGSDKTHSQPEDRLG
jgi:hypothetical protein